VSQKN